MKTKETTQKKKVGRPKSEPTTVIRIPLAIKAQVLKLIEQHNKTLITIMMLIMPLFSFAQLSVGDEFTACVITIKTDTMSVDQSFSLLNKLCAGRMWGYDRKVIYHGQTYLKFGWTFDRKRTYILKGNKYIKIKSINHAKTNL